MEKAINKIKELHELLEDSSNPRLQDLRNYLYSTLVEMENDIEIAQDSEEEKPKEQSSDDIIDTLFS